MTKQLRILTLNKLRQLCYILYRMLNITSRSVRIVPFNHANALWNESMREYSHHSIKRILCPGQNSHQNRAQDSVGTYYTVWLKHIAPKLLLQSTNLAGIWSFTNDSQFTVSRMLWNRIEELQTEKVSIHTVCMNWFDSWEYVLRFFFKNIVQLIHVALTSWKVRSMASVSICLRKAHRVWHALWICLLHESYLNRAIWELMLYSIILSTV